MSLIIEKPGVHVIESRWKCPRPEAATCHTCPAYEACALDAHAEIDRMVKLAEEQRMSDPDAVD